MKVLFADHEPPKAPGVEFTPLQQVLETSDVISLPSAADGGHAPYDRPRAVAAHEAQRPC